MVLLKLKQQLAQGIYNYGGAYEPFSYSKWFNVSGLIRPNNRTHFATLPPDTDLVELILM